MKHITKRDLLRRIDTLEHDLARERTRVRDLTWELNQLRTRRTP